VLHRGQIRLYEPIASLRHHAENPTDAVIDALLKSLRDP